MYCVWPPTGVDYDTVLRFSAFCGGGGFLRDGNPMVLLMAERNRNGLLVCIGGAGSTDVTKYSGFIAGMVDSGTVEQFCVLAGSGTKHS